MRKIIEIQTDIENLVEEMEEMEYGSVEWDFADIDLSALDRELREVEREIWQGLEVVEDA